MPTQHFVFMMAERGILDLQVGCLVSLEAEASADNLYVHNNGPSFLMAFYLLHTDYLPA